MALSLKQPDKNSAKTMQPSDFIEPNSAKEIVEVFRDWLKSPAPNGSGANPFDSTYKALDAILAATIDGVKGKEKWPVVTAEAAVNSLDEADFDLSRVNRFFHPGAIQKFLDARNVSLQEFCARKCCFIPELEVLNPKGGNKKKLAFRVGYRLLEEQPPEMAPDVSNETSAPPPFQAKDDVEYLSEINHDAALIESRQVVYDIDDTPVSRSFLAKWLFPDAPIGFGSIRWWLLQGHSIVAVMVALFLFLSAYGVIFLGQIPTIRDLLKLIIGGLIAPAYIWFYVVKPWMNFLEDRLMMAPETFLAFRDKPAQLELITTSNNKKSIQLVRYKASCPICGASVYLDDGKPDYPRRLVGRCTESPREHVYSFDRVTRMGYALRESAYFPAKSK